MNPTFELVTTLTHRVMGWYGFTYASEYPILGRATEVAIELVRRRATADTLTREDIEAADAATGGNMRAMFEAMHPSQYHGSSVTRLG
jgi:hypothetical protein